MSDSIQVEFTKCHGAGNAFIVVDETRSLQVSDPFKARFSRLVSERCAGGIGADGAIFVSIHDETHPRMQFFNPDGSEAEMSGNGLRCASRVAYESYYKGRSPLVFITRGGRFETYNFFSEEHRLSFVRIHAGHVATNPQHILSNRSTTPFIGQKLEVDGTTLTGTVLSIGNPHLIVTVKKLKEIDLNRLGPALEHHPMFANRANISFVEVLDRQTILVQTHERGAGPTLSCGTGMTASVVAQVLNGNVTNHADIQVHTAGGIAWVHPEVDGQHITARLTGNATHVYRARTRIVLNEDTVTFSADGPMEITETFPIEAQAYETLAKKSLFDVSMLNGTPLESLVQARGSL
ncbi:MAG: diaminopimelate epimerase [Magnetococcales bacterium]|nr:diaminopimelate epimerase [Magnetococcales bacterium]